MSTKIVFLCKGTRGDVQPLLSIALAYKQQHSDDEVVFASVASGLKGLDAVLGSEIKHFALPDTGISLHQDLETAKKLASDEERLEALKVEAAACLEASQGASLIVFNLFTLEGYFIARHLGIPCIAASPHVLTRTPPSGFEGRLARAQPELYQRLKSSPPGCVSFAEVDHWMWRLFLDDFGQVCESLGLPQIPLSPDTPLGPLSPPTPLLYGVSSVVMPRQPYWPQSVSVCGYWLAPLALQVSISPALASLVDAVSSQLLYVGFGSMETYLMDVCWVEVFNVLETALESASMEALLHCMEDGPISQAHSQLPHHPSRVHVWTEPLPHLWLFEKCSAIMHHGGSGTVATALLAKKPQIICPVMFDQRFWAERLSMEGLQLGQQCSHIGQLTARELSHALRVVAGPAVGRAVNDIGEAIRDEKGLENALREIDTVLRTQK